MATKLEDRFYNRITAQVLYNDIKNEKFDCIQNVVLEEVVEIILTPKDDIRGIIFENCIFRFRAEIKGIAKNGIVFKNCFFEESLNIGLNIYFQPGTGQNDIGIDSSLNFKECEINNLNIYPSYLQRGIKIQKSSKINSLVITRLNCR